MRRHARLFASFAATALVLAVPACGGGGGGGGGGEGNQASAILDEYSITLDPTSATAGSVTLNIANDGAKVHELVVFKTDLAADALPTSGGEVDEEGSGLTLVDEQEDIAPGSDTSLTVDLEAGSYVVICNLPDHYEKGMHAAFKVG